MGNWNQAPSEGVIEVNHYHLQQRSQSLQHWVIEASHHHLRQLEHVTTSFGNGSQSLLIYETGQQQVSILE